MFPQQQQVVNESRLFIKRLVDSVIYVLLPTGG